VSAVLSAFLLTFAGLFPIVNPIEAAPFFLALTPNLSNDERCGLARRVAINGFLLLLGSMVLGPGCWYFSALICRWCASRAAWLLRRSGGSF